MTKQKRWFVLLLAAAVCFFMLFSAFFIASEAGHVCSHDNCEICLQVNVCRDALKMAGQAILLLFALLGSVCSLAAAAASTQMTAPLVTPITAKVKLTD